jgi:hypothetical protein
MTSVSFTMLCGTHARQRFEKSGFAIGSQAGAGLQCEISK